MLTRAPAPVGRKRVLTKSPVHERSDALGIEVKTPETLDESLAQWIGRADAVAVVAYGLLVPVSLLDVPRHGWINLHYSLLPQWRGAAPVQYAIAAGQTTTGISTFAIEAGLDTGDVYLSETVDIGEQETATELLSRLSDMGAGLLSRTLTEVGEGLVPVPQSGEPTFAPRLRAEHGKLDVTESARHLANLTRAYDGGPGTWALWNDQRVKIGPATASDRQVSPGRIEVDTDVYLGTGEGSLVLNRIAPPGKQWMNARDWARGLREEIEWT